MPAVAYVEFQGDPERLARGDGAHLAAKCARTLSVATAFPDSGNAAGEASNKPNSQNFALRISLWYPIKRGKTFGLGGLWSNSQSRDRHTAERSLALM